MGSARSSTDRASDYGSEGWRFESFRAHSVKPQLERLKANLTGVSCIAKLRFRGRNDVDPARGPAGSTCVQGFGVGGLMPCYWVSNLTSAKESRACIFYCARLAAACMTASSGPRRKKWNHSAARAAGMTTKNTRHSPSEGAVVAVSISAKNPMICPT